MTEHHWFLHHNKAHCCQPIPGEPHFLTLCGKRVHPLFLSQVTDESMRCKLCIKNVENKQ